MDREELLAAKAEALTILGEGCYNSVKRLSPTLVVRSPLRYRGPEYSNPGTPNDAMSWDYLLWCHLRLLKYGARSPEMEGFPLVLGILMEPNNYIAVMGACRASPWQTNTQKVWQALVSNIGHALKTLREVFDIEADYHVSKPWYCYDLHCQNVMVCVTRGCLVMSDPFSQDETTDPHSLPQPARKLRKAAQWLRPGLKHLYQGARR